MMEKYIADFHTNFYIPAIKNLVFHTPDVRILETNHGGNTCCESFKRCIENQYVFVVVIIMRVWMRVKGEYWSGNHPMESSSQVSSETPCDILPHFLLIVRRLFVYT